MLCFEEQTEEKILFSMTLKENKTTSKVEQTVVNNNAKLRGNVDRAENKYSNDLLILQ